jgi:hypothetical protein
MKYRFVGYNSVGTLCFARPTFDAPHPNIRAPLRVFLETSAEVCHSGESRNPDAGKYLILKRHGSRLSPG